MQVAFGVFAGVFLQGHPKISPTVFKSMVSILAHKKGANNVNYSFSSTCRGARDPLEN